MRSYLWQTFLVIIGWVFIFSGETDAAVAAAVGSCVIAGLRDPT